MHFFAKLRPNSAVWRNWRGANRLSGYLDGVLFRWDMHDYVSSELSDAEIELFRLRADQAVLLEAIALLPEAALAAREEVVPSEDQHAGGDSAPGDKTEPPVDLGAQSKRRPQRRRLQE